MNNSGVQSKLPLPTIILTVIATVVVALQSPSGTPQQLPAGALPQPTFGISFIFGVMALLSLLSFAMTTGEAHADLIIQKAITILQHEDEEQHIKNEQLLQTLLTQ